MSIDVFEQLLLLQGSLLIFYMDFRGKFAYHLL